MVHPDSALRYINHQIGYGVVATRCIPRGSITWVLDDLDQVFTPGDVSRICDFLKPALEKYSFLDAKGQSILCWDNARFINHSCDPTCMNTGFNFEVAIRDIQPGEELTDDYGTLNLLWDFECHCRSAKCRRTIHPDDFPKFLEQWDAAVARVFPLIKSVEQPLWPLVREKVEVEAVLAGKSPIPSCFVHYCKPHAEAGQFLNRS
jgi:hypothetical protein